MAKRKHAEVIKAWADGAVIEWRPCSDSDWGIDCAVLPAFDNDEFEFRVKPVEIPEDFITYTGEPIPYRPDIKGYEFLMQDGTTEFIPSGKGIPYQSRFIAYRIVPNKVVRWQWIISSKADKDYHFMTSEFHTEESVIRRYPRGAFDIFGKAEWTRTEFDK